MKTGPTQTVVGATLVVAHPPFAPIPIAYCEAEGRKSSRTQRSAVRNLESSTHKTPHIRNTHYFLLSCSPEPYAKIPNGLRERGTSITSISSFFFM